MPDKLSIDYINSTDYQTLEDKLKELKEIFDDLSQKSIASRDLRYSEVDIEAERKAQTLQPDELYIPQHIIDTNIRREQSPYVQYITQSPRAIICDDSVDSTVDLSILEKDLTKKLRYDGWQLSQFANIDGFQANGYSIMEVIQDLNNPGEVGHEMVQLGDFAFLSDTRDLQLVEMTGRTYYYTKTRLIALCGDGTKESDWSREQVDKVISKDPSTNDYTVRSNDGRDKSLYMVQKNMFRVNGIVQVAWSCPEVCDNWLRKPRPLFIGMRKPYQASLVEKAQAMMTGQPVKTSEEQYETEYPYILFPYLISENDTISELKGRVFLDQDLQEAVSSLMSSTVTQARRSAGLYFSKDVSDPNDDLLLQKNIFFKSGCLINSKVTQFQLTPPDPAMFSAINMLVTANQNETSQVNFAVNNRKDSRKTAEEIKTASQQATVLSTVQVVLFSIALTQLYRKMTNIIVSRVNAGLIKVSLILAPLYQRKFTVKPSGDTDVVEKQQLIQQMMTAWPVVQNTPCAQSFLSTLLEKMFPDYAARWIQMFEQANQQQASQQNQLLQQGMMVAKQMADGIISLSKKREMFSETGKVYALPALEQAAERLEQIQKQLTNGTPQSK